MGRSLIVIADPSAGGKTHYISHLRKQNIDSGTVILEKDKVKLQIMRKVNNITIDSIKENGKKSFEVLWKIVEKQMEKNKNIIVEENFNN